MQRLTRTEARRIAIRAQLLEAARPTDLLAMVHQLTVLQLDPTAAVAPSADLVAWSRLGNAYEPAHLQQALERDRTLFEVVAMVRPMADLSLYLAEMAAGTAVWPDVAEWLEANDGFRRRVLDQLRASGPLQSRDIPDTSEVIWRSTGWTNDRNVTKLLEVLTARGQVAVSGRRGRQRLWDVAERVYPADMPVVPQEEARRIRAERRLSSLGVARQRYVGDAGIPAEIEGTAGPWRLDPEATADGVEGRIALLSPFDRLIHDRDRIRDLFHFDYLLEMYKPEAKRRWGYFALPVLYEDQLIGKVDAIADRKASVLNVRAVHQDVPFDGEMTDAVNAELSALAGWIGLDEVRFA